MQGKSPGAGKKSLARILGVSCLGAAIVWSIDLGLSAGLRPVFPEIVAILRALKVRPELVDAYSLFWFYCSLILALVILIKIFRLRIERPIDSWVYMGCLALGVSIVHLSIQPKANYLVFRFIPDLLLSPLVAVPLAVGFQGVQAVKAVLRIILLLTASVSLLKQLALIIHPDSFLGAAEVFLANTFIFLIVRRWQVRGYLLMKDKSRAGFISDTMAHGASKPDRVCLACNEVAAHVEYHFGRLDVEECQSCCSIVLPPAKARLLRDFFIPPNAWIPPVPEALGRLSDEVKAVPQPISGDRWRSPVKVNLRKSREIFERYVEQFQLCFEDSAVFRFMYGTRPPRPRGAGTPLGA